MLPKDYLTTFVFYALTLLTVIQSAVIELNEDNWQKVLKSQWMVEFFAPWCPACKNLEKPWSDFSDWSRDLDVNVAKVDITKSPGLSGRFIVTALPTIYHVLNGQFRQYKGARDTSSLIAFIEEKKWEQVEPLPWWKSPDSVPMSIISWFFKLSQILRSLHNKLQVEYGVPAWVSYLIFALGTILLGALLGLLIVCLIDFFYPARPYSLAKKDDDAGFDSPKSRVTELKDEDLKDDLLDDAKDSESESEADDDEDGDGDADEGENEDESNTPLSSGVEDNSSSDFSFYESAKGHKITKASRLKG